MVWKVKLINPLSLTHKWILIVEDRHRRILFLTLPLSLLIVLSLFSLLNTTPETRSFRSSRRRSSMAGIHSFTKQDRDPLFEFLQLHDDSYHTRWLAFSYSFVFISPPFSYRKWKIHALSSLLFPLWMKFFSGVFNKWTAHYSLLIKCYFYFYPSTLRSLSAHLWLSNKPSKLPFQYAWTPGATFKRGRWRRWRG